MFGQTSLHVPPRQHASEDDSMDWEPSPHAAVTNGGWTTRPPTQPDAHYKGNGISRNDWDGFGAGKQRMFEKPRAEVAETGLESLLAGWGISPGPADRVPAEYVHARSQRETPGIVVDGRLVKRFLSAFTALRVFGILVLSILRSFGQPTGQFRQYLDNGHRTLLGLELVASSLDLSLGLQRPNSPSLLRIYGITTGILARLIGLLGPEMFTNTLLDPGWSRIASWGFWGLVNATSLVSTA
jgi:hypothetical protein